MALVLHDTMTGEARPFQPLSSGRVGVYVCGPTVQAPPHVGHVRSAICFDVLRRWLVASGYDVTFVRNVTDIDDKIIDRAAREGVTTWELAERNNRAFTAAYDAVGLLPPTVEPRATGHIPEMFDVMQSLVERGHAYASGGDVYFDVRSFPAYGALSGQRLDAMLATETAEETRAKRDPLDFTLWKAQKPGEPAWPSPWGPGRPGWHLECSAMSVKYLDQPFDIHGGGLDLVFPHHENEVAQSVCAGGVDFAAYWMHNGMLTTAGEKMSKSVGNSTVVSDVLQTVRPQVLRYQLGAAHYRSSLEYSGTALVEAASAYGRFEAFVRNAVDALGGVAEAEARGMEAPDGSALAAARAGFAAAMDDDLSVPRALAGLHDVTTAGNTALGLGELDLVAGWLAVLREGLGVLGLDPVSQWAGASGDLGRTVDALVEIALEARSDARARGDFASADAIRGRLADAGVVVEDTAGGVRWHLAPG